MLKKFFLISLFSLFSSLIAPHAFAQVNLSISPHTFETKGKMGQIINQEIKLKNLTTTPIEVKIQAENFVAKDESGQQNYLSPEQPNTWGVAEWINISTHTVLNSQEEITIPFTIKIPTDTTPGSRFGTIFFTTENKQNTGVNINARLGALVFLTVAGEVKEQANIESLELGTNITSDNIVLVSRIKNKGNVILTPRGKIIIRDPQGEIVKNIGQEKIYDQQQRLIEIKNVDYIPFNTSNYKILPNQTRQIETTWRQTESSNTGDYHAKLIMAYGQQNEFTIEKELNFELKENLIVDNFAVQHRLNPLNSNSNLILTYTNQGNLDLKTRGIIELFNPAGTKIWETNLSPKLIASHQQGQEAISFPDRFSLGRYEFKLTLKYGADDNQPLILTKKVWLFAPEFFLPIILIIILSPGLIIISNHQKHSKKQKQKDD